MARKAGAAWARGNGTIMFYGPHLPGLVWGEGVSNGVYQPTMWLNQNGVRFMNEGINNFAEIGSAIRDVKRLFVIQTEADIDRITAEDGLNGYSGQGGSESPGGVYKDKLMQVIEDGNDYIFIADTLDELAEKTGLPADKLKESAERYTELFQMGVDEDFQKNAVYLSSMAEGPYYAFECFDGFFTTVGGVQIDENIMALDEDGNVIEGLYVGGCDTGALCGDIYDFTSAPGEQSSWAVCSGRMVAKHVAAKKGLM
ncbi:MAG: FAD-binding protein [Coriobacteriales bacterium]|nr:FAD-binding protein [Coriobacteriales bacterium]